MASRGKRVNSIKNAETVPQPLPECCQNLETIPRAYFNQYPVTKPFSGGPNFSYGTWRLVITFNSQKEPVPLGSVS
jgi:hypothetical protein